MNRRRAKKQNVDEREIIRQAAFQTAQDIYRVVARNTPKPFLQRESSSSDNSSTTHTQQPSNVGSPLHAAADRGYMNAINENLDVNSNRENDENRSTAFFPRRHGKIRRRSLVAQKSWQFIPSKQKKIVQGSWMCPCCGAVFLQKEQASKHEYSCIRTTFNFSPGQSGIIVKQRKSNYFSHAENAIPLSHQFKMSMLMTDESLLRVAQRAGKYSLNALQNDAERELVLKAGDRAYYDCMADLSASVASTESTTKVRSRGKLKFMSKIKSKFSDAYTLIKEGGSDEQERGDQYDLRRRGPQQTLNEFTHDANTTYINIVVKHSVLFVNNELERLASERWFYEKKEYKNHFERIRTMAHVHAVRFAQLALSMDLKPGKVAVQLSNDLCRLFPVQLRRFGAEINTAIEYRKGAFFILSVNVLSIDWIILMRHCNHMAMRRKEAWAKSGAGIPDDTVEVKEQQSIKSMITSIATKYTLFEAIEWLLCLLHNFHWTISVPICYLLEHFFSKTIHRFIITAVTDEFFNYVERKGMEMDLEVVSAELQASFMLEALRQIRKDERDRNKRIKAEKGEEEEKNTRGPLLGPEIDLDRNELGTIPVGLVPPPGLEFECIQIDLPVGYLRLRKAFLHTPTFFSDAIFYDGLKYRDIEFEPWDNHDGVIGLEQVPDDVDESDFIGAKQKCQYLMPRSVFVKENVAFEEVHLTSYNPYFFSLKKEISNPDVPYGKTFVTYTQITIFNSGNNSCRMVCSCEAKFPKGPPLVSRQILSAMRAGNQETSILLGETITKYAGIF